MKILHIIPGDNFTEGMTYKDNFLADYNSRDGHDVMILANCLQWDKSELIEGPEEEKIIYDNVKLKRVKYKKFINRYLTYKFRILKDTMDIIRDFEPDIIRVLNPHNLTLPIVVKYKKKYNPNVKLYVDSHQEYYNSGMGFLSHNIFHKIIIKRMLKKSFKYIDNFFYVVEGTKEFVKEMYNVPDQLLEFLPMGGIIHEDTTMNNIRKEIRNKLDIKFDDIVLIHTGKMEKRKKTINILDAVSELNDDKIKLILVGDIPREMYDELKYKIDSNDSIIYLGWKNNIELNRLLIASDIYIQPGTASATIFQALCSNLAIIADNNIKGYQMFLNDGGWHGTEVDEIKNILKDIIENEEILKNKKNNAFNIAQKHFNYEEIARRYIK